MTLHGLHTSHIIHAIRSTKKGLPNTLACICLCEEQGLPPLYPSASLPFTGYVLSYAPMKV